MSLLRRKSISRSPSPSSGSTCSGRSIDHSHCEHRLHILDYELCLSCMNDRRRSKSSSGSLMAKIARKLGRIATKQDQSDPFESPPPFGEDCGDGEERDESSGGNHTLQVPIPRVQQKKMKSISTSHLEKGLDGYVGGYIHVYDLEME